MKARAVFRYELAVNDEVHTLPAGKVLHFTEYRRLHSTERRGRVEVWVEATLSSHEAQSKTVGTQLVQIFGTGQRLPENAVHLATALDGPLVWHLYQLPQH